MKRIIELGLVVSVLAVSSQAALMTLDLRAADGGKVVPVTGASGQSATLSLYIQIQNLNNTHTDDAFSGVSGSITSTESVQASGGAFGDLSTFAVNPAVVTGLSTAGVLYPNLFDSNSDKELGNPNSATTADMVGMGALTPVYGTGSGSGVTEFLLGTVTWTSLSGNLGDSTTSLNWYLRNKAGSYKFYTDGVYNSLNGNDVNLALGAPVVITIPEPACLSLLALGAMGVLSHRRK